MKTKCHWIWSIVSWLHIVRFWHPNNICVKFVNKVHISWSKLHSLSKNENIPAGISVNIFRITVYKTRHWANVEIVVLVEVQNKKNETLEPLSQWEVSSGDLELTRCKSTVKAICVESANSANYPDQWSDANCTVKGQGPKLSQIVHWPVGWVALKSY